jgi:ABC-2 type transport system permease protein
VLSASFVMVFKRGDPMAFVLGGLSAMLGGVFYPVRVLPEWLQSLAALLPITHALDGLRRVLLTGATASDPMVQRDVMVLLLFGAVATPASLLAFRAAVKLARREGTLVQY